MKILISMAHQNPGLFGFSPLKSSSFSIFHRPFSLYPIFASSSPPPSRRRPPPPRRKWTSFEEQNRKGKSPMERDKATSFNPPPSSDSFEFNKRRAAGLDKIDKPKKNLKRNTRTLNPTNTIAYVQILGTGMDTQDTSPSVLLFFDKQRFIFNAGEGLQRFCTEHKIKLSKVDHIFLSRVCSETAGGLPGLLLTLAGIGEEGLSVNVWGPSDLKYLVDAMRSFIPRAAMVHTRSFGPSLNTSDSTRQFGSSKPPMDHYVLVDDEVVKISAILLEPSRLEESGSKTGETSVIYVCELPEINGKFDPKKAMALGLRAGPKYSYLQSGQSVKSDFKDITVHPSDVMGPSVPGPVVLLVDCPTESHAEELLSNPSMKSYYSCPDNSTDGAKLVNCIIHLSPASVTNSSAYQSWMKRFQSAQHILAGHEAKNMEFPILRASSRITARLNYLCPQFFPAPGIWSSQHVNNSINSTSLSKCFDSNLGESISAENLLKFTLRPHGNLGVDRSCIPSRLTSLRVMDELLSEIPEISSKTEEIKRLWNGLHSKMMIEEPWLGESTVPSCLENIRRDDMEIVLLGTGSSQPSKYRNVTAIYIDLFSRGSMLLDCGEGTLGQLKRRYGLEGADEAVRNLRCIWISHIHADHHTGLARILARRRELLKGVPHEPAIVVGPRPLKNFLDAYQRLEDLNMEFLDCRNTTTTSWASLEATRPEKITSSGNAEGSLFSKGSPMQSIYKRPSSPLTDNSSALPFMKKLKKVLGEMGLEELISFPVVHCPQAFGVVVKAAERKNITGDEIPGWKMVYSGDTRPCPQMVEASKGATVLIHEATFEDALIEEAVAKNHSTTKEAIDVGSSAGVYRTVLTHFSQRYPKIPVIDESHMHNTCIAFDMMSINMADIHVLPKILPYFKTLFRNQVVEDEDEEEEEETDDDSLISDKVPSFFIN
ncbi:PREDICTED: zinc phosphodiesterase ELAC protein 2-like isoform X3 [Camelina sativa]|uniref:ribonuclease Z n=1 Tax=Camelina sativa TaxID=90675 RepID=A0ABM0W4P4_CAMSA|nr:PREDICTED: zinc phosphodiesterase ELAC protein 2-like isoform X1 [Camelina sativa]XP_010465642.1 PREDICTED: zinc phosphodiesterase ELAC protein 2-like isoform X4 [Camelina sativa]XP_019092563.1 PREDICTED: zinc phosphodiesterase ELAC protein 2-like isoform X2 [Camelina sativa]XP_019092564.1 PREDICTED: zinc phosphodiesterase ELAC protein 2-like isoform X3 [Camelina sativa]